MKKLALLSLSFCLLGLGAQAQAKELKKSQQKQEASIKSAKKKGRVTDREYEKLMEEQESIKSAIERAELDGVWTSKEKNDVHGKLQRASKRLRRYQNNNEVY